jgi:hypothetical protein
MICKGYYLSFLPRNRVRGKLQQESSIFMELEFSGFPFSRLRAEALRRASTGMTTFYDFINHWI